MLLTLCRRKGGRVPDYGNTPDALSGNEYELGSPCVPGVKLKGTTIRYQDIKDGADLLFVMR